MSSPKGMLVFALLLLLVAGGELLRLQNSGKALEMESLSPARGTLVFLGKGFPDQGIHQFNDDPTPLSVIRRTLSENSFDLEKKPALHIPLHSGEGLEILEKIPQTFEIHRFWSPAEMRMAFFIPLHPDRMSLRDWEALPGIGPKLAARIEENRQKNGDFGSLKSLKRVRGIGDSHIQRWKVFC